MLVASALAPLLSSFMHVPISFIIVGSIAVPFVLAAQPLLGYLQGEQRFESWSTLTVVVALSKLVFVALLVFRLGAFGVISGTTIGAAVTFLACLIFLWKEFTAFKGTYPWRPVVPFIVIGLVATLAVGVFVSVDVIIVEHFFGRVQSGQYAAVAVIGNAVFFLTGGFASVVFPMVAARHATDRSTLGVMGASLSLCAAAGLAGALVLQVFSRQILYHFAGPAYVGGAHLLGLYSVGMAILGCLAILVNTQQSLNRLSILWVLIPITLMRPALLLLFHGTLLTVVIVSDLTVLGSTLVMAAVYVHHERARLRAPGHVVSDPEDTRLLSLALGSLPSRLGGVTAEDEPVAVLSPNWSPSTESPDSGPPGVLTRAFSWADRGVRSPRRVAVALGVVGLLVWRVWLTSVPLTSGDWNWESHGAAAAWFPWPSIWNTTLGLNGENVFLNVFRFPVYALGGFFSTLGASWSVVEKLIYFLPFAVVLPVAGWLLAREILGNTKWTLLTPLLLLGSTYFVIEANSEIPLALAEALGCLALVTFIRSMRRVSLRWGLVTGLLVGVTATMDIRPAYLVVLLMVGYLVILTIAEKGSPLFRRRLIIAAVAAATFVGSQAYWIVPYLTYGGRVQLPIPQTPDFNVITLEHGLTGVSAFWTGGNPANLVEAPLNPLFMVLPIVALVPLLRRRPSPELVWLSLAALVAAFLAKTDTAPFGALYDWMYRHLPGFNLFREGSKFLFIVTVAYAILIPASLRSLVEVSRRLSRSKRQSVEVLVSVALVVVLGLSAWGIERDRGAEARLHDHAPGQARRLHGRVRHPRRRPHIRQRALVRSTGVHHQRPEVPSLRHRVVYSSVGEPQRERDDHRAQSA